jgi:predicted DNA-binding transcriptional regulator YafY
MNHHHQRRSRLGTRLFQLPYLLEGRRLSQSELMEHFGVDRKTIVATVDALDYIIEEREGRHVYYRLSEEYKAPRLTLGESATLMLAQQAIGLTARSPFARQAQSLLKKIRAALPTGMHARLDALSQVYGSATAPAKDFAACGNTIEQLVTAALDRRTVRMRYYTINSDTTKERDFDPYAVYFDPDGATLKVIGWDHPNQRFTPFAIDHIKALHLTPQTFVRQPFNLKDHLETYCFNGIHGEPMTVRLRAYGVTARVFAERKFHRSQRKLASTPRTDTQPESITIELNVARGRGLLRFILSWLPDIEVLAPASLRQELADVLRQSTERNAPE